MKQKGEKHSDGPRDPVAGKPETGFYEGLARRYRPATFEDVIGQRHVVGTLTKAIASGRRASAYLFIGGRGLGKTTMARLLAKAINCEKGPTALPCCRCASCIEIAGGRNIDVLEIDAASNTGVDNVRDSIIQAVSTAPARSRAKIFIIDEVHMLSITAFNALLKTIEEPPAHVVFILATTEGHKVPATIRSRCQRFDFRPPSSEELTERLSRIARAEKIDIDEASLALICDYAEGGVRDALSALDLIRAFCADGITITTAEEALGVVSSVTIEHMMKLISAGDAGGLVELVASAICSGADSMEILRGLLNSFRKALLADVARSPGASGASTISPRAVGVDASGLPGGQDPASRGRIVHSIEAILESLDRTRSTRHSRIELEILLCRLASMKAEEVTLKDLYSRIVEWERQEPPRALERVTERAPGRVSQDLFREKLRKTSAVGEALLKDANLVLVSSSEFRIEFHQPFSYARYSKDKTVQGSVEKVLTELSGHAVQVAAVLMEDSASTEEPSVERHTPDAREAAVAEKPKKDITQKPPGLEANAGRPADTRDSDIERIKKIFKTDMIEIIE